MKKFRNYIWYEKHRPNTLDNLTLKSSTRKDFEQYIEDQNIPHLLLSGPRGSGKTTISKIIIDTIPCKALKLNASSSDRGVDVIKKKVKDFARSGNKDLKIVLFDEADGLTRDAQFALKNTIEQYSKNCRFIFTCNHLDKVLPEIRSRCINYTFDQFPKKKLIRVLVKMLKKEGIKKINKDLIVKIIDRHFPDIRTIINELQACCLSGKFDESRVSVINVKTADILRFLSKGYVMSLRTLLKGQTDYVWLFKLLFDEYVPTLKNDKLKSEAAYVIAEYLFRDSTIPDREINMIYCLVELMGDKAKWGK